MSAASRVLCSVSSTVTVGSAAGSAAATNGLPNPPVSWTYTAG
jgi:hypothetical protein